MNKCVFQLHAKEPIGAAIDGIVAISRVLEEIVTLDNCIEPDHRDVPGGELAHNAWLKASLLGAMSQLSKGIRDNVNKVGEMIPGEPPEHYDDY